MPNALFREQFRLNKQTFDELSLDFCNHTALRGTREIPLEIKVLCALSSLATQGLTRRSLDSGYPQRAWLMTPISNAAPGSQEEIYTIRHILARNCIERCFGLLKARWRCLLKHRTLHYRPYVATKIIVACCVLHNIALDARLATPSDTGEHHDGNVAEQHDDHNVSEQHDNTNVIEVNSSNPNNQEDLICGRTMLRCLVDRM
ncbi:Putative nuclease HARBI1 [Eumeta japonica]|uniref:Nuclease HARBI1 n=1 Tax=Eumeta variegata TaxID=151549 RepID=A0A4C1VV35_EUMVA|nr:Putative nuclease HARBI1 [Eumeta japonica]